MMDERQVIAKNLQDIKILRDIRRLLGSMELLEGERTVLASDDLYPHNSDFGMLQRSCARTFRSRSVYTKAGPQQHSSKTAYRYGQGSSGSSSNNSSSTSTSNQSSLYIRNWQRKLSDGQRQVPVSHHHPQESGICVKSHSQRLTTRNHLSTTQRSADNIQLKKKIHVSSPNIEQSRFYKTRPQVLDTCERNTNDIAKRSNNQSPVSSCHSLESCVSFSQSHDLSSAAREHDTQNPSDPIKNTLPESDERSQDKTGETIYESNRDSLNPTSSSNLSFYASRKTKHLQKTVEFSDDDLYHGSYRNGSTPTEACHEPTEDLLESVLNGRSLFGCSSHSHLYFQKSNKRTPRAVQKGRFSKL